MAKVMKYLRKYNESTEDTEDIKNILEINLEDLPVDNILVDQKC